MFVKIFTGYVSTSIICILRTTSMSKQCCQDYEKLNNLSWNINGSACLLRYSV